MRSISLDGAYRLYYGDEQLHPAGKESLACIDAQVPGNVEIDLMREGILPDIYFAENITRLKPFEYYRWIYERSFECPAFHSKERVFLRFKGVDCIATYTLNHQTFAHSENALIEHRFEITLLLQEDQNLLTVEIASPMLYAASQSYDAHCAHMQTNYESLRVRKAPSCYGWDIMPRVLSAGLWRGVSLEIESANEIKDVYFATRSLFENKARMVCAYQTQSDALHFENLSLRISGSLDGETLFVVEKAIDFPCGRFDFEVESPRLWWPSGYGDSPVYDVCVEMIKDCVVIADYQTIFGIRTIALRRKEMAQSGEGDFTFLVNGVPILCKGSNWVPADALHSRDAARYERILKLFTDSHCNILRCWGGNVYEDHAFFDYCDRHGIMVWQDFSLACGVYPNDDAFCAVMQAEAESIVQKIRNHASIILWSGDNECDALSLMLTGQDPTENRLTRDVLPNVIRRLDPYRPYLPSSPYITKELLRISPNYEDIQSLLPEAHLWGPRDYFKSAFYTNATPYFVSETGYHGCNNLSSMKTFLDESHLWPWQNNLQWVLHGTDVKGLDGEYAYRIQLIADQTHALFGFTSKCLEDFILASQISQAEACKFFIEHTRIQNPRRTGVIWWNMIDGWPQFSDAVVSYDFSKKLAYYYIRRAQETVCLMMSDPEDWHIHLYAGNDSLNDASVEEIKVWDGDTDEMLYAGNAIAKANVSSKIASIRVSYGDQRLLLMTWKINGITFGNHYVLGTPPLPWTRYTAWLKKISSLPQPFVCEVIETNQTSTHP